MKKIVLILRSAFFYALLVVLCSVFWTAMLLAFFSYKLRYKIARGACQSIIFLAQKICGIDYIVEGEENISDNAVILSKHQSAWETLFFVAYLKHPVSYILKRELLLIPFIGWGLFLLEMIPIDRGNKSFQRAYKKTLSLLKRGRSIIIFPEGTRAFPGQKLPFKSGGAMLACKTRHAVIPVTLNAGSFWKKGDWVKEPGTITVRFFPPIESSRYKPHELNEKVKSIIDEATQQLEQKIKSKNHFMKK